MCHKRGHNRVHHNAHPMYFGEETIGGDAILKVVK